jgi:hypothetical protein
VCDREIQSQDNCVRSNFDKEMSDQYKQVYQDQVDLISALQSEVEYLRSRLSTLLDFAEKTFEEYAVNINAELCTATKELEIAKTAVATLTEELQYAASALTESNALLKGAYIKKGGLFVAYAPSKFPTANRCSRSSTPQLLPLATPSMANTSHPPQSASSRHGIADNNSTEPRKSEVKMSSSDAVHANSTTVPASVVSLKLLIQTQQEGHPPSDETDSPHDGLLTPFRRIQVCCTVADDIVG